MRPLADGVGCARITFGGDASRVVEPPGRFFFHGSNFLGSGDLMSPLFGSSELVFTAEDGAPLYPDTVTALMRKLVADHNSPAIPGRGPGRPRKPLPGPDAPLPPARLHDLRHVHATTLLVAGVPVHVVANRLGHADPSTTLKVYAHVLREQAAGAADVFAHAVEAAVGKGVSG
jgi:hypothetical protein